VANDNFRFCIKKEIFDITIILKDLLKLLQLFDNKFYTVINKDNTEHKMEFFKNDNRLASYGSSERRKDAFKKGNIGDYIVFQLEGAVFHM
jgi:hypothetical protein